MPQAHVTWVSGQRFVGIDSTKHAIVMSSADEGIGMKPAELLLVALGGCTGIDIVNILKKQRQTLSELDIIVTGEQDAEPPWAYRKIHVEYVLRGKDLQEDVVKQAIELSETKYCSVGATISGRATITSSFRIENE
jgi:putative redox protein